MASEAVKYYRSWLNILKNAAQIWLDSNAFANAGSLAFFTLFSIAPVMIVIVSVIGVFYGQEAAPGQIAAQLQETIGAEAAETVQMAVSQSSLKEGGLLATLAGILAMLVGATTVFGQMQNSLNAIWTVVPKPSRNSLFLFLRKRFTSLTIALAVGRTLIALYLSSAATASTYGAAGSLVLLLLWVTYSSLILLYGAAFTQANLLARGLNIQPRSVAVRIRREIIED